jgi:hypothetical protein
LPSGPRPLHLPLPRRRPVLPAAGAVAAAILAFVILRESFRSAEFAVPVTVVTPAVLKEPLDLADSREVDIISIDDDDTRYLLVGRSPIREPLQLAGPGDVTNIGFESLPGVSPDLRHTGALSIIVPSPTADAP